MLAQYPRRKTTAADSVRQNRQMKYNDLKSIYGQINSPVSGSPQNSFA